MNDSVKKVVESFGVIAETTGILRDSLVRAGFTRAEAIELCKTYIQTAFGSAAGQNKG